MQMTHQPKKKKIWKGSDLMDRTEAMNQKLYEKLSAEYGKFYDHLKTLPPEEIIRSSYEKVFKEDLLLCFEVTDLDYDKAKALHSLKDPLDDLYNEWLGTDCSYMDMLRDVIDTRSESAIKELKQKSKAQER
ncbi:MAG: DUF3848 domain-containing protein [Clostridia bacterium]|nr:DUF3848 domain-containing protein [Clostridia bacterium]